MITVQILTKNNEQTIGRCLESVKLLNCNVQVLDMESTDKTVSVCSTIGYKPISITGNNRSVIRNKHLEGVQGWKLMIEPHEYIARGHEELLEIQKLDQPSAFMVPVVQGTIISRELRFWNKSSIFTNPVYEKLQDKTALFTDRVLIRSQQHNVNWQERLKSVEQWKSQEGLTLEPYYYQALTLLMLGRYADFLNAAEAYVFKEKHGIATTMLKYYMALVQANCFQDYDTAVKNIIICLSVKPLMAEFWCLLGDIHFQLKNYVKSKEFYDNAIILGSRRKTNDKWPLDVSKYQEHPSKMLAVLGK